MPHSDSTFPPVSIVIRAKNEARLIGRCLASLRSQDYPGPVEMLVIDSGSRDATAAIVRETPGVRLLEIPPHEFNYGRTLNRGIRETAGAFVVALSAHCIPLDEHWLTALTRPLIDDARVAAVHGRQVPWPRCEPVERCAFEASFGVQDTLTEGVHGVRSPLEVFFSNANSCLRRTVVETIPFLELSWAEDRVWAHAALGAGHRIAYAAAAAVYHSHNRSVREYYRTGLLNGRMKRQLGLRYSGESPWRALRPAPLVARLASWAYRAEQPGLLSRVVSVTHSTARVTAFLLGEWISGRRRETNRNG